MNILPSKMRELLYDDSVREKIAELQRYLVEGYKMSPQSAQKRIDRIDSFLLSLKAPVDYAPCRFERWRKLGYRCVLFEKTWVFAYELFDEGVVVMDMMHAKLLH